MSTTYPNAKGTVWDSRTVHSAQGSHWKTCSSLYFDKVSLAAQERVDREGTRLRAEASTKVTLCLEGVVAVRVPGNGRTQS